MPNDQVLPVIRELSITYFYNNEITNINPEDAYYDNNEEERRLRMIAIIEQYPASVFAESYRQYLREHPEFQQIVLSECKSAMPMYLKAAEQYQKSQSPSLASTKNCDQKRADYK